MVPGSGGGRTYSGAVTEPLVRVLGPITVAGTARTLIRPRHRELLGILVAARGGPVRTGALIDHLWDEPAMGAVGAIRTFVSELRRVLEPGRPARTPSALLITANDGYALQLPVANVDVWRAERWIRESSGVDTEAAERLLTAAIAEWRGSPFEEFADRAWVVPERARLADLYAEAVERLAVARLALGRPSEVIRLLDRQIATHPWREGAWRLLALALYRDERQGEALDLLRRAREGLNNDLGIDPGGRLAELELRILRRDPDLDLPDLTGSILLSTVSALRGGARAQLEGASVLLPGLALAGGLEPARVQRLAVISAAEAIGDPELTARVIGGFDVPGIWTRSDAPEQSAAVVDAALRTLAALPPGGWTRSRARLLATVAMESRGTASRAAEAEEAQLLARELGDPQLECFALSARFMQSFATTGLASARERLATELLAIAIPAELTTFEIQARLIRMQALCALDDLPAAGREADEVDVLAVQHERQLAMVFTGWFRWTFLRAAGPPPDAPEMPGFNSGIRALAEFATALRTGGNLPDGAFGPYEPWTRPVLLARGRHRDGAIAALDSLADPPHDLLQEVLWCLVGRVALDVGHHPAAERAEAALRPAAAERAAGSAVVDLGQVSDILSELASFTHV